MHNINDVFASLDARIDQIKAQDFKHWVSLRPLYRKPNITNIERNIFRFESDAVRRTEISLSEIKKLLERGIENMPLYIFYPDETITYYDSEWTAEETKYAEKKREEEYEILKNELEFYVTELTKIRNEFAAKKTIEDQATTTININSDFKITKLKTTYPSIQENLLSKEQIAILFHYLKEKNIILPYDDQSISKLVSLLTGYSENTLRTEGFGHIYDIKSQVPHIQKKKGKKITNLEIVKDTLEKLVQDISLELEKQSSRK